MDEDREKERVRKLTEEYLAALREGIAERERLIDNLSLLTEKSEARIDSTNNMISKLAGVLDRISGEYTRHIDILVAKRSEDEKKILEFSNSISSLSRSLEALSASMQKEKERNDRIERAFLDLVSQVAHPAINNNVSAKQTNVPKSYTDDDL